MSAHQRTIAHVRAYTVSGGGADYHDQGADHWIDDHISTPMSIYPEYADSRQSFGLNVLGTLMVELEADDGTIGFAVSTGGELGAWIVEKHLARFLEGAAVTDIERIWDQMYRSTLFYGRRGIVLNTISAVDLALYDLLGRLRQEPVYALLGGPVRDELSMYATGARPDVAQQLGFLGGKMPLHHGPADGEEGMEKNIALLAEMRRQGRRRFLAHVRLLDVARRRLRDAARAPGARARAALARGGAHPRRLLGLPAAAQERPEGHAHHDRRARGHPVGIPAAARDGLRRTSSSPTWAGAAASPSC